MYVASQKLQEKIVTDASLRKTQDATDDQISVTSSGIAPVHGMYVWNVCTYGMYVCVYVLCVCVYVLQHRKERECALAC